MTTNHTDPHIKHTEASLKSRLGYWNDTATSPSNGKVYCQGHFAAWLAVPAPGEQVWPSPGAMICRCATKRPDVDTASDREVSDRVRPGDPARLYLHDRSGP